MDFSTNDISTIEELFHIELILLGLFPLFFQVNRVKVKNSLIISANINIPSSILDIYDSADHNISYICLILLSDCLYCQ